MIDVSAKTQSVGHINDPVATSVTVYSVPHLNGDVAPRQGMMCSMRSSSNACLL